MLHRYKVEISHPIYSLGVVRQLSSIPSNKNTLKGKLFHKAKDMKKIATAE
jgi:hypothetical protein